MINRVKRKTPSPIYPSIIQNIDWEISPIYRRKYRFGNKKIIMEIKVAKIFKLIRIVLKFEEKLRYVKLFEKMWHKEDVRDKTNAPMARIWSGNNFFNGLAFFINSLWT